MRHLVPLCLALACSAHPSPPDAGTIGSVIRFVPPPAPDLSALPGDRTDAGAVVLTKVAQFQLQWQQPTKGPLSAAAACTNWVLECVKARHPFDDCARSVPTCTTPEPWNEADACCPAECFQRYATRRLAGTNDLDAFLDGFLSRTEPCIPGMAALLGAHP